jgi:hypothetical protein
MAVKSVRNTAKLRCATLARLLASSASVRPGAASRRKQQRADDGAALAARPDSVSGAGLPSQGAYRAPGGVSLSLSPWMMCRQAPQPRLPSLLQFAHERQASAAALPLSSGAGASAVWRDRFLPQTSETLAAVAGGGSRRRVTLWIIGWRSQPDFLPQVRRVVCSVRQPAGQLHEWVRGRALPSTFRQLTRAWM